MRYTYGDRVRDFHLDPYFPTFLPLALVLALPGWLGDWVWFRSNGTPRALKPSRWDNPVSAALNRSLLGGGGPRPLRRWERVLLALGF